MRLSVQRSQGNGMSRSQTYKPIVLMCLLIPSAVIAKDWDCNDTDRGIRPDSRVVDSIVAATREKPQEALARLQALEQKFTGWRERAALYDYLGKYYGELEKFEEARKVYQAGFDLVGPNTIVRENYRSALAVVLSRLERDDEIIALYARTDRPVCEYADQAGIFILAQAYALKGRFAESEALIEVRLKKEQDEIGELLYGDDWLKLGLATACELRRESLCVSRWEQLLRWPFRGPELSERLSRYVSLLRSWTLGFQVLDRAGSEGLVAGDIVVARSFQRSPMKPIKRVAPQYPLDAARSRIEGHVVLDVLVGPDGKVQATRIREAVPARIFDRVAVEAVRKWEFEPATLDGKPIQRLGRQTIDFSLAKR